MSAKKTTEEKQKFIDVTEAELKVIPSTRQEIMIDEHPMHEALHAFLQRMEDAHSAAVLSITMVGKFHTSEVEKLQKYVGKYTWDDTGEIGRQATHVKTPHEASALQAKVRELDRMRSSRVLHVLEKSLYIGIFCEYDVFIGKLLKAIYTKNPKLFKGIKREIALSDLLEFDSVDAVKRDILEKEIDTFRRDSYVEQFCELERKFDIKTLRKFDDWPNFVEFGQRRNLMTHNGGVCSEQYLIICEREGYKFEKRPIVGEQLTIGANYFRDAIKTVSKVAYMLTHTLWRKVLPEDLSSATNSLNRTVYDVLAKKKWALAAEFGLFALSDVMIKGISDLDHRMLVINTAIGLKYSNKKERASAMIDAMDWTASIRDFKLACAVLKEDYPVAAELMRDIGKEGEMVRQMSYHDWPLFHTFRDSIEFQQAYEEIYGVPFIEKVAEDAIAQSENASPQPLDTRIRKSEGINDAEDKGKTAPKRRNSPTKNKPKNVLAATRRRQSK